MDGPKLWMFRQQLLRLDSTELSQVERYVRDLQGKRSDTIKERVAREGHQARSLLVLLLVRGREATARVHREVRPRRGKEARRGEAMNGEVAARTREKQARHITRTTNERKG